MRDKDKEKLKQLLDCPFCGRECQIQVTRNIEKDTTIQELYGSIYGYTRYKIKCDSYFCPVKPEVSDSNFNDCIDRWNTRTINKDLFKKEIRELVYDTPLNDLDFSVRTYNVFAANNLKTIRDLKEFGIWKLSQNAKNFGITCEIEVKKLILKELGLHLN